MLPSLLAVGGALTAFNRPAAAQTSPCYTNGAFPKASRMAEADRNTFIYNLPSKLLTEEDAVRTRARDLAEADRPTCLRVEGELIQQDFWSKQRMYVSDGTRLYTILLVDAGGKADPDLGDVQRVLACRVPRGRLTVVGEFAGIEPVHNVRPYNRYWGRAVMPAAVIEPGPMTVVVTVPRLVEVEHPRTGRLVPFLEFAKWSDAPSNPDTAAFDACHARLIAYRTDVSKRLHNAQQPETALRAMNDSLNAAGPSPYSGLEGRYQANRARDSLARDSALRGDTACTVRGAQRLLGKLRRVCR